MSRRGASAAARFLRDGRGASAVEFALVAAPFLMLVLGALQVGIYYMTQAALEIGVNRVADELRNTFTQATPAMPSASTLKSNVVARAGRLISNNANLAVDLRQMTALGAGNVAVTDGTTDYGSTRSVLVLRAQATTVTFAPGFSGLARVTSSAIVRRQGR